MLMISIFTTMLIMVFFTRYLLKMFVESNYFEDKVNFFIGKAKPHKSKIDFIKHSKFSIYITLSESIKHQKYKHLDSSSQELLTSSVKRFPKIFWFLLILIYLSKNFFSQKTYYEILSINAKQFKLQTVDCDEVGDVFTQRKGV